MALKHKNQPLEVEILYYRNKKLHVPKIAKHQLQKPKFTKCSVKLQFLLMFEPKLLY